MERYVGGTEIQQGVIPLSADAAKTAPQDVATKLIQANNKMRLYGIGSSNPADGGAASRLFNGGLLYPDLQHPEYATPECRDLDDIPIFEMAGRRLTESLLKLATYGQPTHIIVANNHDHHNATFAYHENYLAGDNKNPNALADYLLPFLVTRTIFAGAGLVLSDKLQKKLKKESQLKSVPGFSIAQRSLWATVKADGTLCIGNYSRLVGANRHNGKLLHITSGDANVLADTTKLKIGTTALVHQMLEDGWTPPEELRTQLHQTVDNLRRIALNNTFNWDYKLDKGNVVPAITIQRMYLEEAKKRFKGRDKDTDWTLEMWEKTLDTLETNPLKADWLDWVNKFKLINRFDAKGWTRDELIRVDLAFHIANPYKSIHRLLGGTGVDETAIMKARNTPPQNTRAAARGGALSFLDQILGKDTALPVVSWELVSFKGKNLYTPDSHQTYQKELANFKKQVLAAQDKSRFQFWQRSQT